MLEISGAGSRLTHGWLPPERLAGFLLRDGWVQQREELRARIAAANELEPVALTDAQVVDLLEFLAALSDPAATDLSDLEPQAVPSGLAVVN